MTSTTTTATTLYTKWMGLSETSQFSSNSNEDVLIGKFIEMGVPVLKKFKSGFLADIGDIQFCLLLHFETNKELKVQLCALDDGGQLVDRLTLTGDQAVKMVKMFVADFPNAVLTTSERKPLCLFAVPSSSGDVDVKKQAADGEDVSLLGVFQGYMNFATFQRIISDKSKKISVAVPK